MERNFEQINIISMFCFLAYLGKAQSKVKKKSSKKKGYTGISSSLLQQLTNDLTKNYMPKSGPGESEDALNREIDMLVNSKTIEGGNSEEYALHLTSGDLPIIKTEGKTMNEGNIFSEIE